MKTKHQNFYDRAKAVFIGALKVLKLFMKNEKSLKSIICYLRKSEKGQIKTQSKEMKDIIKIKANINGKEKKKNQ